MRGKSLNFEIDIGVVLDTRLPVQLAGIYRTDSIQLLQAVEDRDSLQPDGLPRVVMVNHCGNQNRTSCYQAFHDDLSICRNRYKEKKENCG